MPSSPKPPPPFKSLVAAWLIAKRDAAAASKEEDRFKAQVKEVLLASGSPDEKGSHWIELDEPVTGWTASGEEVTYAQVQAQKRKSEYLDEEEAARILESHGLLQECSETWIRVTDEERALDVLAKAGLLPENVEVRTQILDEQVRLAFYAKKLPVEEYRKMLKERVTWAIVPTR